VSVRYSLEDDQGNVIPRQYHFYKGTVVRKQKNKYYWIKWDNGDEEDLVHLPDNSKHWNIVSNKKHNTTIKF